MWVEIEEQPKSGVEMRVACSIESFRWFGVPLNLIVFGFEVF